MTTRTQAHLSTPRDQLTLPDIVDVYLLFLDTADICSDQYHHRSPPELYRYSTLSQYPIPEK